MSDCTSTTTGSNVVLVDAYRGDTVKLKVELFGATGGVDIAGWLWEAQVRDATDAEVASMSTVLVDVDKGVIELGLSPAQTGALVPGDFTFDLEATDASNAVRTLFVGRMRIRPDVSR
jgi:hypothetical protein